MAQQKTISYRKHIEEINATWQRWRDETKDQARAEVIAALRNDASQGKTALYWYDRLLGNL